MVMQRRIFGLGVGLLCSMVLSCSLVFDSDEYLAKNESVERDGGGGTGGSGGEKDSGGSNDAAADDSTTNEGDSGARDTGAGAEEDTGTPPPPVQCDEQTDCNERLGTGWASICFKGECINCDRDNDGWISPIGGCDSLVVPTDLRDCDDNDEDRYPHAPAVCGDRKFNACDVELTQQAEAQFQVAEIGFIGLTLISSVHENIEDGYRADFTRASQISIAGQQVGEVGVNSHLVAMLTFMDSDGSADQPDQANIARLMAIGVWEDGWPDAQFMDQYNLNDFAKTNEVRSVSIKRLYNSNSVITAMVGNDNARSNGSGGEALWYTRVASTGDERYEPTDLQRVSIPQTPPCSDNGSDSTNALFPRLAIAGQATEGLARTFWTQSVSNSQSPIIFSHLYSSASSTSANPFSCTTLDNLTEGTRYVDLSGSAGPFVVGGSAGQAFSWEGTASSPITSLSLFTITDGRPAFAFFDSAEYLASITGAGGYWLSNLTCQPGSTEPCGIDDIRHISLPVSTDLAAMDSLGARAATLGLVERNQLEGSLAPREQAVVRILDKNGNVLPIGGVRYQTEPGGIDAQPEPSAASSLFPVFELESGDDSTSTFRVVDLAVSSWIEEANTASQYPLTILIAAIVTTEPDDISVSDGQPASGNLIVLTGIRGCREL